MIKSVNTSVTMHTSSWLAALYKGKGSVNKLHLLATSPVAKYQSSTATLKSLWHLDAGWLHYSSNYHIYPACTLRTTAYSVLQHTTYIHIAFDGNSASLQHWVMSLKGFVGVLSSYTTQTCQIKTAVNFLTSCSNWTCPHTITIYRI